MSTSTERIIINEKDQSNSRPVLADVFNVLVVHDTLFTNKDSTFYDDSESFKTKYTDNTHSNVIDAICDIINEGLGVYVSSYSNLSDFKDKYRYDFAFLMDFEDRMLPPEEPSLADTDDGESTSNNYGNIKGLIEYRKDFIYLPADMSDDSDTTNSQVVANNVYANMSSANSSYVALYSPAVKVKEESDSVPASYCFLRNFAKSVANGNPAWYAVAGVNRGIVNYISSTIRTIPESEMNTCQDKSDTTNSNYNPIINLNNTYGNVIYGQRTLLRENTSLKSVNVRIISNMIKKRIFNISLTLLFEMNDITLWNEFRGQLNPYLSSMKFGRGLYDYEIVMDQDHQDPSDEMTVKGYVRVKPTRTAEYFNIDFTLSNSSAEVGTEE